MRHHFPGYADGYWTISVDLAETETEMASFHIEMPPFHGKTGENATDWIGWFTNSADTDVEEVVERSSEKGLASTQADGEADNVPGEREKGEITELRKTGGIKTRIIVAQKQKGVESDKDEAGK